MPAFDRIARLSSFAALGLACAAPLAATSEQEEVAASQRQMEADLKDLEQRIKAAPPGAFDPGAMKSRAKSLEAEAKATEAALADFTKRAQDPYSMLPDVTLPSGEVVSGKRYLNQILQGIPAEGKLVLPASVGVRGTRGPLELKPYIDVIASTPNESPTTRLNDSPIIFGGTGSDRAGRSAIDGVDLRGKTVVLFQDYRATHRWKVAIDRGATAVLLIVSDRPNPNGWDVARSTWGMSHQAMSQDLMTRGRVDVVGLLSFEGARKLFANAGLDIASELAAAQQPDFRPKSLGSSASITLEVRDAKSVDPDSWMKPAPTAKPKATKRKN